MNGELFSDVALDEIRASRLRVFIEVTERSPHDPPADLLAQSSGYGRRCRCRARRCRRRRSLPCPDAIPAAGRGEARPAPDPGRGQRECGAHVNAINAEAERTGAVVLAEGIETDAHLFRAQALGAQLGQGWLFGRPGPLPFPFRNRWTQRSRSSMGRHTLPGRATPFTLVSEQRSMRRGDKKLLLRLPRQLEAHAAEIGRRGRGARDVPARRGSSPPDQADMYRDLARHVDFRRSLWRQRGRASAPGVRGPTSPAVPTSRESGTCSSWGPTSPAGFVGPRPPATKDPTRHAVSTSR